MTKTALEGCRVIDFTESIAGAHCTMMLADLGAEVIKVEQTGESSSLRNRFNKVKDADPVFTAYNRNKKSLALDLQSEDAKKIVRKLLAKAEVVVLDFEAEKVKNLDLDYEKLKSEFPRLIFTEITPFGETGPYSTRPMFEGTLQAESGMSQSILNDSGKAPVLVGGHPAEISCGMVTNIAILSALHHLSQTGQGQKIVSNMYTSFTLMFNFSIMDYLFNHVEKPVDGNSPNCFLKTKTDWIRVTCGDGPIWNRTIELVPDEFLREERFQDPAVRLEYQDEIIEHMQDWVKQYTAQEVMDIFTEKGIPCGIVRTMEDLQHNVHLLERKQVVNIDVDGIGPVPYFANPCRLNDSPVSYKQGPKLGENTREILSELLQFTDSEISEMKCSGSIE